MVGNVYQKLTETIPADFHTATVLWLTDPSLKLCMKLHYPHNHVAHD